ncbi:hypothetical protein TA3x_004265 [Tundrisphaera sp. TA3]|uniref:hypothetical protein n=1 Tax=Tundrisphaera sp. TA3 TaxID=3435775 RepID=UPI003EBAA5D8
MDTSEVAKLAEKHAKPIMEFLGISYWQVKFQCCRLPSTEDGQVAGDCTPFIDYETATIKIDPEAVENEEGLIDLLHHEACHILVSPFSRYLDAVETVLSNEQTAITRQVYHSANEAAVLLLHRNWLHQMRQVYLDKIKDQGVKEQPKEVKKELDFGLDGISMGK